MANNNSDGYSTPVDFRVTSNPQPVKDQTSNYNFQEIYDFIRQVILTFVRYCGIGTYDTSFWPLLANDPGQLLFEGNVNKIYVTSLGTFPKGTYISLFLNAGVLTAFKARANVIGNQADGFCNSDFVTGQIGEMIMSRGLNPWLTGLTIGQRYWLSLTVSGSIQTTPPVAAGNVEQYIGIAVSSTELVTNIMYPIQH